MISPSSPGKSRLALAVCLRRMTWSPTKAVLSQTNSASRKRYRSGKICRGCFAGQRRPNNPHGASVTSSRRNSALRRALRRGARRRSRACKNRGRNAPVQRADDAEQADAWRWLWRRDRAQLRERDFAGSGWSISVMGAPSFCLPRFNAPRNTGPAWSRAGPAPRAAERTVGETRNRFPL